MTPDIAKQALVECARYSADIAKISHQKSIEEHNAAFRWLLASLFALNGGAVLALLNVSLTKQGGILWSAPLFFCGILATFWMALTAQNSDKRMIAAMAVWGAYWTEVSITGEFQQDREAEIKHRIDVAEKFGRQARLSGIVAMLFFTIGCLTTGFQVLT